MRLISILSRCNHRAYYTTVQIAKAYIDVESQREWLAQKYDVSGMTDSEIEVANTGSIIFAGADITIQDCIEDLSFKIGLE